jgi:hypothetical protein
MSSCNRVLRHHYVIFLPKEKPGNSVPAPKSLRMEIGSTQALMGLFHVPFT